MLGTALIGLLALQPWAVAGRILPRNAMLGELTATSYPFVTIGDKQFHLAPGTRIFDQNNRIILPVSMPARAIVLYKIDSNGDLINMWLLTPDELATIKH